MDYNYFTELWRRYFGTCRSKNGTLSRSATLVSTFDSGRYLEVVDGLPHPSRLSST
jgi:hypothetical protein